MNNQLRNHYSSAMERITEQVSKIDQNNSNTISSSKAMVYFLKDELNKLKEFVMTYSFLDNNEEIEFFKIMKPTISSSLIYFNKIYWIEINAPLMNEESLKEYFLNQLQQLKKEYEQDSAFYQYYRSGASYSDSFYFLRGQSDINAFTETFYFDYDIKFSTYYDYKVASLLANEKLSSYLHNRLNQQKNSYTPEFDLYKMLGKQFKWTESIAALVELIYGLSVIGCINNGAAEISEITKLFATIFNCEVGDVYHSFNALKNKKGNPTAFLDNVIKRLKEYMNRED